jgi:hypothetical protein
VISAFGERAAARKPIGWSLGQCPLDRLIHGGRHAARVPVPLRGFLGHEPRDDRPRGRTGVRRLAGEQLVGDGT